MRQLRPSDLQDTRPAKISPMELGLVEQPTRPRSEYTMAAWREAKEATDSGQLRQAADLTRAAMTEDAYARGVIAQLTEGLWGLPMNFLGDPRMIAALTDTPSGSGQWREMFPQPEAIRLMSWGINLGVGVGQMRHKWQEPGEHAVSLEEVEDGSYKIAKPIRPVGAHATRVLRTWDPKWLRHQWWDDTWWLMTADCEIRITPNDGEWILYMPYGSQKPWEYGAWKALTMAFVLGRDAMFDESRHAEVLAPVRVGKVPQGTTQRQRQEFLRQIREMQRMAAFVLPPGLDYSIVESTGRITDIYEKIIARCERQYCLIYTGNETTTKGTSGFSEGDVQERIASSKLKSFSGSLSICLRDGGLRDWAIANYGSDDPPLAQFDCEPPEDKLAKAKTVTAAGESLTSMAAGLREFNLRITVQSATAYAQSFGFAVEPIPVAVATQEPKESPIAQGDLAKALRADEIRALSGVPPFGDPRGDMVLSTLNAPPGGGPPGFGVPPAAPVLPPAPVVTVAESDSPPTDESAAILAAKMTEHGIPRCEHERSNRCLMCGVERTRDFDAGAGPSGEHVWRVAWRPIGAAVAPVAEPIAEPVTLAAAVEPDPIQDPVSAALEELARALATIDALGPEDRIAAGYNPDQDRADDGKFGSGGGGAKADKSKAPAKSKSAPKGTKDGLGASKAAKVARPASFDAMASSAAAKGGSGSHEDAAKMHEDAAAKHRDAAKASRKPEYKAAHQAAADAHAKVAEAHRAEHAAKPQATAPAQPSPVATPHEQPAATDTPEHIKADVTAKVASLPKHDDWKASPAAVKAGVATSTAHIESKLTDMPDHEIASCQAFSNGHDGEMRALERGATKADLVAARVKKGESEVIAQAHVNKSIALLPGFHDAQARLATTTPPPPALARGMAASDKTLHDLLTKDSFTNTGMSSSASLDPHIGVEFAKNSIGQPDFRGDKTAHKVVLMINKAKSAPIMHSELSKYGDQEAEQILDRSSTYDITHRTVDSDGVIVIHMNQRGV